MNKKDLVKLIIKTADELEDAPGVTPPKPKPAPSPAPPNLPPPPAPPIGTPAPSDLGTGVGTREVPTTPVVTSSPVVSEMQKQLQALARDMTRQVSMEQLAGPKTPDKPQGGLGQDATDAQRQAYGRMSFADFITQHYTRDSDIPGVEYDWDPSKTKMEEKDPSKPTRTNVVMDTMTRIGNPTKPGQKPEFAIDGDWGPRTNASLRNAYAMAFGLLEMSREFNFRPRAFNPRDLATLKQLIPPTSKDIDFQEKVKRAKEIVPILKAVRNFYQETQDHILNKTEFSTYIDGSQPYLTYGPGAVPDAAKIADLNKKFSHLMVTVNVDGRKFQSPITVGDLVSTQALEAWQQKNMPSAELTDILAQVKSQLNDAGPGGGTTL